MRRASKCTPWCITVLRGSRYLESSFLWTKFQVLHLMKYTTPFHVQNAVGELPPGLCQTFMRSMDSINALPGATSRQCLRALYWLACARRPLTSTELMEAIAIDDMDEAWDPTRVVSDPTVIINYCANLISPENGTDNQRVRLFHPSVKDFLVDHPTLFVPMLPRAVTPDHYGLQFLLARDCLKYLTIVSHKPALFLPHSSQNFSHYLRNAGAYGQHLADLFIAVVRSAIAQDVFAYYKCSLPCGCVL